MPGEQTDGRTDGRADGRTGRRTGRQTDRLADGWADRRADGLAADANDIMKNIDVQRLLYHHNRKTGNQAVNCFSFL